MPDVRLVTCLDLPEPDHDEAPLVEALTAAGLNVDVAAWDDPTVAWGDTRLTVIRSTWNYHHKRREFHEWATRVAAQTALRNPVSLLVATSHKSYLAKLERAGIDVVPTRWLTRTAAPLAGKDLAAMLPWDDVVIKPAVSAGSWGTRRFRLRGDAADAADGDALTIWESAAAHINDVRATRDVMVQPTLASILSNDPDQGERNLVWIAGEFTHTIRKQARFSADDESVSQALTPATDELQLAQRALTALLPPEEWQRLLYARVDMARDELGTLRVVEVELIEPSLFLVQHPPALQRMVSALAHHAVGAPAPA